MSDVLYLAWRYLLYHRVKTTVLIAVITITIFLPLGLEIIVSQSADQLTARARSTPMLVGAKGSPLDLVLNSLYFRTTPPPSLPYSELTRIQQSGLASAVPLQTQFRTRESPIVGTTLDYFEMRHLTIGEGRQLGMLGECVLGATAAEKAQVKPGDYVLSAHENIVDITAYPLKMKVVGVLKPTGTADDEAVFVDVKTTWVIKGLGHGHQDLAKPGASSGVLKKEGNRIIANASVVEHNEITPENVGTFHFHGDPETFPITGVIVVPVDEKSSTLLQGRYLGPKELVQIVRPTVVMDDLLKTIFTVRSYVMVAIVILGAATLATLVLVFLLSLQQRRREMETMSKIGGSRLRIAAIVSCEILAVLITGILLAVGLAVVTAWFAPQVTRAFVVNL